jgi:hypothetical protein
MAAKKDDCSCSQRVSRRYCFGIHWTCTGASVDSKIHWTLLDHFFCICIFNSQVHASYLLVHVCLRLSSLSTWSARGYDRANAQGTR